MMNYMRSEWYRITHTKDIYVFTGIMAAGVLLLNVGQYVCSAVIPDFRYSSVKFALSFLTGGMGALFLTGMILAMVLFSADQKNGIAKNAVAYGISREKLFIGKCIVSFAAALISMMILLVLYIGTAVLLLEGPAQPYVGLLLEGVLCNLPAAAAFMILAVALGQFFEKDSVAIVLWVAVYYFIPVATFMLGLEIPALEKVAKWMPCYYLNFEVVAGMSGYDCLWSEPAGAARCIIAGVIGIIVFLTAGILMNRRKEL